jgi:UDP-N-acetylmuramoyl-tripeptide--D-alanyl-D-alanine ligase
VVRLNVGQLIVVGEGARHIHNAAGLEGSWDGESQLTSTADSAYDLLREDLRAGDIVLVGSSGLMPLESITARLSGGATW